VAERADYLCEYCLYPDESGVSFHVDHIISVKHGGSTTEDNLGYACVFCNLQKGTDLGSIIWRTREIVRFFNPRLDFWGEHFRLEENVIQALTEIGEVTVRIFDFNSEPRILERQILMAIGSYPSAAALRRINR